MTNLTDTLHNVIDSFSHTLADIFNALYTEANTRKATLAAAIADMHEANTTIATFSQDMARLSVVACQHAEEMERMNENVSFMLCGMEVFKTPVETFNGYCDMCGEEMAVEDEIYDEEVGFICAPCYDKIRTGEPVQLTIINANEEEA